MSPHFSSSIIKHSTSRMLIVKMKTMQQLLHLLFIWLLLAAIPSHYSPISTARDIYTGKLHVHHISSQSSTLSNNIRTTDGYVLPTMGKEMIHKKPSGPNPIGNQQPPTRP
nr:CLAVATA3/ESR (CLE)-related protein 46 [Ipomoea batatas]